MGLKHKFKAKPTNIDNIRFDSKKEAAFYTQLKTRQKSGEVIGFFRQVPLHLTANIRYVMDFFVFYADGTCEGIEVKGFETEGWKLKKKMVDELYPWIELKIVK